jgi:hypothetical protein
MYHLTEESNLIITILNYKIVIFKIITSNSITFLIHNQISYYINYKINHSIWHFFNSCKYFYISSILHLFSFKTPKFSANHIIICFWDYIYWDTIKKRLKNYSFCKINSKGFYLTIVQLNPVKTGEKRNE